MTSTIVKEIAAVAAPVHLNSEIAVGIILGFGLNPAATEKILQSFAAGDAQSTGIGIKDQGFFTQSAGLKVIGIVEEHRFPEVHPVDRLR